MGSPMAAASRVAGRRSREEFSAKKNQADFLFQYGEPLSIKLK